MFSPVWMFSAPDPSLDIELLLPDWNVNEPEALLSLVASTASPLLPDDFPLIIVTSRWATRFKFPEVNTPLDVVKAIVPESC